MYMKRMIAVLICTLFMLSTYIGVQQESNIQILKYGNLEKTYAEPFIIPDISDIVQPDVLFQILSETAKKTNSNIIRTNITEGESAGTYELNKYLLIANEDSLYLRSYILDSGHFLTSKESMERNGNHFLSTKTGNGESQTGILHSDMLNMEINIYPLEREFDYIKADGLYYAELAEDTSLNDFLTVLCANIERISSVSVSISDVQGEPSTVGIPYTDISTSCLLLLFVCLFTVLMVFYYLLREKRTAAIMKLMGVRPAIIWKEQFGEPAVISLVFGAIGSLVFTAYKRNIFYVLEVTGYGWLIVGVFLLIFIAASHIVNKRLRFHHALKGEKYTNGILAIQTIAELACIFFIIYTGATTYSDITELRQEMERNRSWTVAEDYGIFYPFYSGDEQTEREKNDTEILIGESLYTELNGQGALFVNAADYENQDIALHGEPESRDYQFSMKVNPNYLQAYPVLNEDGQRISISEDENALILLIPVTYKEDEEQIRIFYQEEQDSFRFIDEDVYGLQNADLENQEVKIIWTREGQSVFAFDSKVETSTGEVMDPVIVVITENNSFISQRVGVLGKGNADPLKVKLYGNSKETYESIYPALQTLGLDDNLKALVSVDEQMLETITLIKVNLYLTVRVLILLFLVTIFLIYQSTMLLFDQNRRDYTIKSVFGIRWDKIYGRICLGKTVSLLLLSVIYAVFVKYGGIGYLVFAAALLIGIQIVVIYLCTMQQQRKRRIDILKGN